MAFLRVRYNSPVVLSFSLLCVLVQVIGTISGGFVRRYFAVGGTIYWGWPVNWFQLFSHVLGHASWTHLTGNLAFILLIGPMLEEKYGSARMLMMIVVTAPVVAILNAMLFDTGLYGASSIVFMMIALTSIVSVNQNEIPITFMLVVLIFVGRELISAFGTDGISQSSHMFGAAVGFAFGYLWRPEETSQIPSTQGL